MILPVSPTVGRGTVMDVRGVTMRVESVLAKMEEVVFYYLGSHASKRGGVETKVR